MGIVVKKQPIGVDIPISKINERLYTLLIQNAQWANYDAYHRAYANETRKGIVPEAYTEQSVNTKEYHEVLMNDNVNSTSFFMLNDVNTNDGDLFDNSISIYFQLNTRELYQDVEHRADEEARNDVIVSLKKIPQVKSIDNVVLGLSNVYAGFRQDNLTWDDMQPYHVFRIDITVEAMYDCDWICGFTPESVGGFDFLLDGLMN
tara:strand:+ start:6574 stop:7185 length:612 start_codon:yes stop_codon:yes gene_type:complete